MLFHSMAYAIFLPIVFILYHVAPRRFRWALLLAASWWFCASFDVRFLIVLLCATAASYLSGLLIGREEDPRRKKRILAAGILLFAAVLGVFKYTNFVIRNLNRLWSLAGEVPLSSVSILLPIGISFYTFQIISYLVDIYRGKIQPERHFGYYALYVSFFPSLTSGPIGRADKLIPQYRSLAEQEFEPSDISYGLKLMAWGYFLKLCIADNLSPYVDQVYSDPMTNSGLICYVAPIFYSFVIYADFAGYSAIAVGTARLFGVQLDSNFKSPYCSRSVREFWTRWHKTLSAWLRDYIYIPLGGSRCSRARHCLNLMITFLVSGLWHGAGWTFILWGALHGFYQVIPVLFRRSAKTKITVAPASGKKHRLLHLPEVFACFLLVTFAWMFFRADSVRTVFILLKRGLIGIQDPVSYLKGFVIAMNTSYLEMVWLMIPLIILIAADIAGRDKDMALETSRYSPWLKYPLYVLLLLAILLFSNKNVATGFIYTAF